MISHPKMVDTDGDGYNDYLEVKGFEMPEKTPDLFRSLSGVDTLTQYSYKSPSLLNNADPLKWNVSDRHLAMLSHLSYSSKSLKYLHDYDKNEFMSLASVRELEGWRKAYGVVNLKNKHSVEEKEIGFAANVYVKDKNVVIAFRGSSDRIDWKQNVTSTVNSVKLHPQTKDVENFIKQTMNSFIKDDSYNLYVTGHSLGGLLALHGTYEVEKSEYKNALKRTATFNGLGVERFAPRDIKKTLKATSDIIADYVIEGLWGSDCDVVSKIGISYGKKHTYPVIKRCLEAEGVKDLKIYEVWRVAGYGKAMHRLANFYAYDELKNISY